MVTMLLSCTVMKIRRLKRWTLADGRTNARTDVHAILYSVQCYAVHWTDNKCIIDLQNVVFMYTNVQHSAYAHAEYGLRRTVDNSHTVTPQRSKNNNFKLSMHVSATMHLHCTTDDCFLYIEKNAAYHSQFIWL